MNNNIFYFSFLFNNVYKFLNGNVVGFNVFGGGGFLGFGLGGLGFVNLGGIGNSVVVNSILVYVVLLSGGGLGVNNFFFNAMGNLGFLGLLIFGL